MFKFLFISLRHNQVVWVFLDIARLSYPLKWVMRRGVLKTIKHGSLLPVLPAEAFNSYKSLFSDNHYDGNQIWRFNSQDITVDEGFLFKPMDKADYTYRMVFFHFEWMFKNANPDLETLDNLSRMLEQSAMFNHPSPMSQRVFVLAWVVAHVDDLEAFEEQFRRYLRRLILTTENAVGANHLTDNFLAIVLLAKMLGLDLIVAWAMGQLRKSCAAWVNAGFFCEKTPCYQALLLGRVRLVQLALLADNKKSDVEFLGKMLEVLQRFPAVHLHDSYLPRSQWKSFTSGPAPYARNLFWGADMTVTLIADARSDRGCRGHMHDASGALFVHHRDGAQLLGGLGTVTYKTSPQRDACRSAMAYCIPHPKNNHTPRLIPWKSFRHVRCRAVDVDDRSRAGLLDIEFYDRRGSGARWRWEGMERQLRLTCDRQNVLGFWSDLDPDEFAATVRIHANSAPVTSRPSERFDGIGNALPCYFYEIEFETTLIMDLLI